MTRAYLALAAICIIWGTTYTAIKLAVREFPPYMLVGIRQTMAGLLLLGVAAASGKLRMPNRKYLLRQGLAGLFSITGGNGFITWGMQFVSSGLAAIIGSLTPVVVVLINLAWRGTERINARVIAGVLLGFGGLGLIFSDGWQDFLKPEYRLGIAGCFVSCVTWSLGTVMSKRWNAPEVPAIMNAGMQITAGGLGGIALSFLFDNHHSINPSTQAWLSVLYLAVIGSALAFTLYLYALQHLSATVSSLYTYINPVVAIILGWAFLGESLTLPAAGGMLVTIMGVYLVNLGQRR
ncbi:MAG: EamA family transporter [Lewinellaceae bacterium]|jgi:drug/metabolite transporter (DMT)-like permease|nr:EamA family transporter [Lewinellaceae bacterium]